MLCENFSSIVVNEVVNSSWIKGAFEFLKNYYQKITFYIASATPEKELLKITEKRMMTQFFKRIYGSPLSKKDILSNIILQEQCDKKEFVMIGDSNSDYYAAIDNSIDFIGIGNSQELFPKAQQVLGNLERLENYIVKK